MDAAQSSLYGGIRVPNCQISLREVAHMHISERFGGTSLVCHMLLLLVLGDLNAVLVLERFNIRKLGV